MRLAAITLLTLSSTAAGSAQQAADRSVPDELMAWFEPIEPLRIVGPIHYVGTRELGAYLIATPAGHILIDGAMPSSAPLIESSIRKLGFNPEEIRVLLFNHAHVDHVGTLAYFKNLSGARVAGMEPDLALLKSGGKLDFLYAMDPKFHFEPVTGDQPLKDGDTVELGGVRLTARHTPGHTRGCATFVTTVEEGGRLFRVVFLGATNINPGTKLVKDPSYPGISGDYRRTIALLESLKPDIFLTGHASFSDLPSKRARAVKEGVRAFVDPEGYRRRISSEKANIEAAMTKELAGAGSRR